jgi:hypothetical protein
MIIIFSKIFAFNHLFTDQYYWDHEVVFECSFEQTSDLMIEIVLCRVHKNSNQW